MEIRRLTVEHYDQLLDLLNYVFGIKNGKKMDVKFTSMMLTYLVWRRGMGRDTHRKGSKVLLCFRRWGQVKEDL